MEDPTAALGSPSRGESTRVMVPAHAFGVQNHVQNNVLAVDETTIIHPVGRAVALYNLESKRMAFIREGTLERGEIVGLALSPSKKYVAVCERADIPQLSIYHIASQKKTKTLKAESSSRAESQVPVETASDRFVSAAFSPDSKMLAAVTGDGGLALWLWDKSRLLGFSKTVLQSAGGGPAPSISRASFNPADATMIAASGPRFFRLWRFADGKELKPWNVAASKGREHPAYTDHLWLPGDDRVALCTDTAEIHICEKGDLKHVLTAAQAAGAPALTCLAAFARGFIAAAKGGLLCLFEGPKDDAKDPYQLTHTFVCSSPAPGPRMGASAPPSEPLDISAISITPSEELLLLSCGNSQVTCMACSSMHPMHVLSTCASS